MQSDSGTAVSPRVASVRAGPKQCTVHCVFPFRRPGVCSEEDERWQTQSCSLPHEPERLVVWEPRGAQWRPASTSSSGRGAVLSGPVTSVWLPRRGLSSASPLEFCEVWTLLFLATWAPSVPHSSWCCPSPAPASLFRPGVKGLPQWLGHPHLWGLVIARQRI